MFKSFINCGINLNNFCVKSRNFNLIYVYFIKNLLIFQEVVMVTEEEQSDMKLASENVPVPQVQDQSEVHLNKLENQEVNIPRRKPRSRKKELHASILKQMEFYFSNANLSKDRFLANLIKQDPYIDIEIFLRFNKIRALTSDTNRIAKALRSSTMLSVSEDGTKICRITPIVQKENSDECTIYVQRLPPHADHEMLESIFSQYGSIAYISVPKYKSNQKIKGFGFVEFDTFESANKCIKAFRAKGCELPSQTSPDNVLSITTYTENNEMDYPTLKEENPKSFDANQQNNGIFVGSSENDVTSPKKTKKRSPSNESANSNKEHEDEKTKSKKRKKIEDIDSEIAECKNSDEEIVEELKKTSVKESEKSEQNEKSKTHKKKRKLTENVEEMPEKVPRIEKNVQEIDELKTKEENKEEEAEEKTKKKKKRKRKRESKGEKIDATDMGLQVMAKKEWKRLRNKYLELQRAKMKQLKQHLKRARWNQWNNAEKNRIEREENEEKIVPPKQSGIRNFSFTPGIIVKIEMDEPCTDSKNFKMELKGNSGVKYIDVSEGSTTAYVRCDTVETAKEFAQKSFSDRKMSIIKDDEEKSYWDKMLKDREEKIGNKTRVKQRGRNKLLKKAEKELGKHIKFDEV